MSERLNETYERKSSIRRLLGALSLRRTPKENTPKLPLTITDLPSGIGRLKEAVAEWWDPNTPSIRTYDSRLVADRRDFKNIRPITPAEQRDIDAIVATFGFDSERTGAEESQCLPAD